MNKLENVRSRLALSSKNSDHMTIDPPYQVNSKQPKTRGAATALVTSDVLFTIL